MKKEIEQKENKQNNTKMPKEVSQEIMKQIFKNILIAIFIMAYFAILNFANSRMKLDRLVEDLKIFAGVFLVMGIVLLERAYKKDSGKMAIPAIEWIAMSLHTLSIMHVIKMFEYNFMLYLLTSSYIIAIYFVFKCIVIYTKGRREYLKKYSDISEIVKKEEPIVKEATKKNVTTKEETKEEKKQKIDINSNKAKKKTSSTKAKKEENKSQSNQATKRKKKTESENKEIKKVRGKEND